MADPIPLFHILDDGNSSGAAPNQIITGDAPGTKKGLLAFAFRDSAGNVVLPQLTSDGKVPISPTSPGTCKRARGEDLAGGVGSGNAVDVATLNLVTSKFYAQFSFRVSSRQDSLFQLIWNNNGVETVLTDAVTGAGQYTVDSSENSCLEFQAGATGTQQLILRAYNFQKASALRGDFACLERT